MQNEGQSAWSLEFGINLDFYSTSFDLNFTFVEVAGGDFYLIEESDTEIIINSVNLENKKLEVLEKRRNNGIIKSIYGSHKHSSYLFKTSTRWIGEDQVLAKFGQKELNELIKIRAFDLTTNTWMEDKFGECMILRMQPSCFVTPN